MQYTRYIVKNSRLKKTVKYDIVFISFYKTTLFFTVHKVSVRSATLGGLRMCDCITVQHIKTCYIYNGRGIVLNLYVCLDFGVLFRLYWIIFLNSTVIGILFSFKTFFQIFLSNETYTGSKIHECSLV